MTRTTSRIAMALLALVAAPVAGLDLSTAAERQAPGITSTSPELERRDRAVTADDLRS